MFPPKTIPENLINEFTMDGKAQIRDWYRDDSFSTGEIYYPPKLFNYYLDVIKYQKTQYYPQTDLWLYQLLEKYPLKNKKILIYGSVKPWYEAVCLAYKCTDITVLEYNKRVCKEKYIKYIQTPDQLDSEYDVIISISSFEHDGLGRYGDPINPNGDIDSMKQVKQLLSNNGILILSVPIGVDQVVWNVHRVYGVHRLSLLINGFDIIDSYGYDKSRLNDLVPIKQTSGYQPIFVLQVFK